MRAADGFPRFLPEFFRNHPVPGIVVDITCLGDRIQKTVSGMRRGVNSRMVSAGVPENGYGDRKNGFGDSPGERPSPNKSDFPRVYARFLRKAAENTRAAVRNSPSNAP